ncbi:MAG: hypothetical protein M3Q87_02765 [Actinomycetota bacterium]|nr:hypothetical protein [Actinomycetota bacterium]
MSSGWVQHGWFTVDDTHRKPRMVTAYNMHAVSSAPLFGACLVGAVVYAAGGPPAARTQLVQRTLDLTWHALYNDEHEPVRWCPAPGVRTAHLRDLTRWNDHDGRTAAQVEALLRAAVGAANTETARLRGSAA